MADTAVHSFTEKTTLVGTDEFYLVQSPYGAGDDRRVSLTNLAKAALVATLVGTGAAGLVLNNLTTTQRDAVASPATGSLIYNSTTARPELYKSAAWHGLAVLDGYYPTSDTTFGASIAIGPSALVGPTLSAAYGNGAIGYQAVAGTLTTGAVGVTAGGYQALAVGGDADVGERPGPPRCPARSGRW
mgnify:CR=1 FL=1